jgi:signal transduction histidine kinase
VASIPEQQGPAAALAELVRSGQAEIVADWERAARPLGEAKGLAGPALVDDMAAVVEQLPAALRRSGEEPPALASAVGAHALARLGHGFDLAQAVTEYALLRDVILARWGAASGLPDAPVRALDAAIDRVIAETVALHAARRNRVLLALDRISAAALEEQSVERLLGALLEALLESCPAIDTAAFLLLEEGGDRLRVVATRGLADAAGFTVAVGEGFAGRVAAERRPIALREASQDPLVTAPHLRGRGIRALYGIPLLSGGELVGVVHAGSREHEEFGDDDRQLLRTLAERAAAGIRINALLQRIRASEAAARRAVRVREDVLAVVSHDLKTPLHAIRLTAELLARKAPDPLVARHARSIHRAAERGNALLRDLLDMASIQAGRLAVNPAPADPVEIAAAALELAAPAAEDRGVPLVREGTAAPVLADRARVEQVLGNLLGNAIKFSPAGAAVRVRLADVADGVRFEVTDEGAGIAPEDLSRIFDAYWSARTAHGVPAADRGAGLGLFIAKGILEAHGSALEVASGPGRGSTFAFTLRRA